MKKNIGRKTNVTRVYIWYEFMADFMIFKKNLYAFQVFFKACIIS